MSLGKEGTLATKEKKSQQIQELAEKFSASKAVVLTEYKGLTVAELSALRKSLKEVSGEYKVVKNTLSSLASKDSPVSSAKDEFTGPTGLAFGYDDPIAVAKKVLEFADKHDKLKVKSGIIEGKLYSASDIKAVSKLPSKQVLLSMIAGVFQAPASKLAGALNATVAQLGYALRALESKKSSG